MTRSPGAPSRAGIAVLITLAKVSLRLFGLHRTLGYARRVAGRAGRSASTPDALIGKAARRVAEVSAFYPGRALCLEQSIALYVALRRRGVPAELMLGVRPSPFSAHAWVEHEGRPINEAEAFVVGLARFPSVGG